MADLSPDSTEKQLRHPIHLLEHRALKGDAAPFAIIPKSKDPSLGFIEVSYKVLVNAVNRVAWWLEKMTDGPKPGTTLSWSGPNDFRYAVHFLAAMKCRYKLLLPSPRNSEEYQRTIFQVSGCQFACGTKAALAKLKKPLDGLPVRPVEGMTLEQILDPALEPVYPCEFTLEEAKRDTPLVLHTSGSTGPPKAIPLPLECFITAAHTHLLPGPSELRLTSIIRHKRLFCGFPPFHAAGSMVSVVWPLILEYTTVWGPADRPLTHAIAQEFIRQSQADCATLPPSIVEDMAESPSGIECLSALDFVMYGGGPLQAATGDKVSEATRLLNAYGSTETLLLPQRVTDKEDWSYIELDPKFGYEFEHVQEGLYKLLIRRVPEFVPIQPVFLLMPDLDLYDTGDLVSSHPTKPNLWSITGRADDLIILSSGEKFDPAPGEAVVRRSPLVRSCLLVGRGRPQALLLVERDPDATKGMSAEDLARALWPVVEDMNRHMATQAHITPDHVVLAPLGVELPRTPKGTIRRRAAEEMFDRELSIASGQAGTDSDVAQRSVNNGERDQAVREIVFSICGVTGIDEDEDLFEYGLDSIQAQQLSAALRKISDLWPADPVAASNIIYSQPTIRGLITAVTGNGCQDSETISTSALIKKYTADLPSRLALDEPSRGLTVAITGSTGNLGCHMLNDLVRHPRVSKVICLNRAAGGEAAQVAAFRRHRLSPAALGDTIVSYYKIDLSDPFLGLSQVQYATLLREVEVVIHNAWQLDFLRKVDGFEKTHITGVRHLAELAACSLRDMRIVFISSIGAVAGTDPSEFTVVPEEPVSLGMAAGPNGYSQAKFVAERILEAAAKNCHIRSAIVRVGQIAGPSDEAAGTWSATDWFPRIMASAQRLRMVPDDLGGPAAVDWLPINVVSEVIMDIVEATRDSVEQGLSVFHVVNPHVVPWKDLAPELASFLGPDVHLLNLKDWISAVQKAVQGDGAGGLPVETLLPWLRDMSQVEGNMARLAVDKTMALSPALGRPGPIQASWVRRWMADWQYES